MYFVLLFGALCLNQAFGQLNDTTAPTYFDDQKAEIAAMYGAIPGIYQIDKRISLEDLNPIVMPFSGIRSCSTRQLGMALAGRVSQSREQKILLRRQFNQQTAHLIRSVKG